MLCHCAWTVQPLMLCVLNDRWAGQKVEVSSHRVCVQSLSNTCSLRYSLSCCVA